MIISFTYYLGDTSEYKYFETLEEMQRFVEKCIDVRQNEYNTFEFSMIYGKEEERIRKIMEAKK